MLGSFTFREYRYAVLYEAKLIIICYTAGDVYYINTYYSCFLFSYPSLSSSLFRRLHFFLCLDFSMSLLLGHLPPGQILLKCLLGWGREDRLTMHYRLPHVLWAGRWNIAICVCLGGCHNVSETR